MQKGRRWSATAVLAAMAMTAACRSGAGSRADSTTVPRADSTERSAAAELPRADSVALRTEQSRYHAGDAMALTITNASAQQYAFNPCQRTIERRENDAWMAVDEPGRVCTMEAWILEPHGTRSAQTELPSTLAGGTYRVVIRLTVEGSGASAGAVAAVSDPIVVS